MVNIRFTKEDIELVNRFRKQVTRESVLITIYFFVFMPA